MLGHGGGYRRDIDGLRAIAVLSVVLYHFGVPGFSGGFVGVDVFFVISGYLIGGILWREYHDTGRIWLLHFYIRRFRRLMPAFFVMVAATTAVAWFLLLPFEFREYGKMLIASTVYLSNVLFYRSAGYFDTVSEEKLLLHTWSLSVEEQFYIFLPLFLLLLARVRWAVVPLLLVIFAASLAANFWMTPRDQPAAFFLFPFRMWEMLAGVLLAIAGQRFRWTWRGWGILSYIGLIIVLASVLFIQPDDRFPGYYVVAPVLGTILLLAFGQGDNAVNHLLRTRFMVFFGLISYSLYLWHWPVMTLSTYLRGSYANLGEAALWMLLSVALATLSWRFVEAPVRRAQRLPGWLILGGAVTASGAVLAVGALLYLRDGMIDRFGPQVRPHIAASADFLQDFSRCTVPGSGPLKGLEVCPIGPEGDPKVLVWGDSHVRAFKEGLDLAAHEAGTPGIIIWRAGCPPLYDVRKVESYATPTEDLACLNANLQIKQSFNRLPSLQHVLLIGRWSYYATGTGAGLDAGNTIQVLPKEGALELGRTQAMLFDDSATATVKDLFQRFQTVSVLRQPPEVAMYDSRRAAREAAHAGWPLAAAPVTQATIPLAQAADRAAAGEAPFRRLQAEGWISWLDPWPAFCDGSACHALVNGEGFFFDNNHVTNTAALRLRELFRPVFGPVQSAAATGVDQ